MTIFVLHGDAKVAGVPTDGLPCVAYAESRFAGTPPTLGSPVPDMSSPDGGPVNSASAFGGTGMFQITVPTAGNYYVGCWDPNNPALIAWEGPKMATPHTSLQGWTATGFDSGGGPQTQVTIASGSNSVALPTGTINVSSTTPLASSGSVVIMISGVGVLVAYTSLSGGTQLLGCTGGSGTLLTGQTVSQAHFSGATSRRLVNIAGSFHTTGGTDQANITPWTTLSGTALAYAPLGIAVSGSALNLDLSETIPVDPNALWWTITNLIGSGSATVSFRWVDF